MVIVPLTVVAAYLYIPSVGVQLLAGATIIHVGVALCIDWAIRFPHKLIGRGLNARPLVWLGTISYSLYLWQHSSCAAIVLDHGVPAEPRAGVRLCDPQLPVDRTAPLATARTFRDLTRKWHQRSEAKWIWPR